MNSFEEEIVFDVVATVAFKKDKKRYSKSSKLPKRLLTNPSFSDTVL